MKCLTIFLAVTFGLTWGLLIPAGFALETFQNGESSSALMLGPIGLSMIFPLLGAHAANIAPTMIEVGDIWPASCPAAIPAEDDTV